MEKGLDIYQAGFRIGFLTCCFESQKGLDLEQSKKFIKFLEFLNNYNKNVRVVHGEILNYIKETYNLEMSKGI